VTGFARNTEDCATASRRDARVAGEANKINRARRGRIHAAAEFTPQQRVGDAKGYLRSKKAPDRKPPLSVIRQRCNATDLVWRVGAFYVWGFGGDERAVFLKETLRGNRTANVVPSVSVDLTLSVPP